MMINVLKTKNLRSIIGIVLLLLVFLAHPLLMSQEHKPLKYRVDVKASLIPLFVVDSKGNAVFDLKKRDLELYVNGKLTDIYEMMVYRFESSEEMVEKAKAEGVQSVKRVFTEPKRVIFIILDSMNCSFYGVDRSKRIAMELIRKGDSGDMFVILMVTLESGLKYIAGPERKSEDLVKRVKKLKVIPGKSISKQFLTGHAARLAIRQFVSSIAQLEYALKTITKPKLLFLISEGLSERAWGGGSPFSAENPHYYFTYLMKAINQGGCVINVLYAGRRLHMRDATYVFLGPLEYMPGIDRDHTKSTEWMLKDIAVKSGGAFFINPDIDTMVTSIKKTTAAYYEVVFIQKEEMKERQRILIKSKRKDIVIHTLNYTEAEKEYKKMEKMQKKVFAINVATEGSWSRMVGQVRRTRYKKLQKEKKGKRTFYKIEVPIPEELRNKQADIFVLRFDKSYEHADINYIKQSLNEKEILEIDSKKNKKLLYFVIIEPESTHTIYNQVR
jgi:VWFA-related protein